jgi:hypothetical protein
MKKIFLIIVGIFVLLSFISAQTLKPIQLKNARMAAYQWVRDYNIYAQMAERRNPTRKFLSLFKADDIQIVNDYLPSISDKGAMISVHDYAKLVSNKSSMYTMQYDISDANIVSESQLDRNTIEFIVEFKKKVEFSERDRYDDARFAYPEKYYTAIVTLHYDVRREEIVAVALESEDNFESIMILHEEFAEEVNKYTDVGELEQYCRRMTTPLIKWSYAPFDFDAQIFHYQQDTIKRHLHFGLDGGLSFAAAKIDAPTANLSNDLCGTYGINIGMYHQLSYKNNQRWGFEYDLHIYCVGLGISGIYEDAYMTIDPDGGAYKRMIQLTDYVERINRIALELPIAFRFDYMLRNDLSLYTRFGVDFSYDVYQTTKVNAHANYSGYYDWLFGVTIDQNGIYDFGQFDLQTTANRTSLNSLALGAFLGLGVQYFIPDSKWSLQCGLHYGCKVYNGLSKSGEIHLSDNINDWQSATALYKYFFGQRFSAQIQLNYNF